MFKSFWLGDQRAIRYYIYNQKKWWWWFPTRLCPPSDVCWFIIPLTIDISTISPSELGVINQLSKRTGAPSCKIGLPPVIIHIIQILIFHEINHPAGVSRVFPRWWGDSIRSSLAPNEIGNMF